MMEGGEPMGRRQVTTATAAPRRYNMLFLILLLLPLLRQARAKVTNECQFPAAWSGRWFILGKEGPIITNTSHFLDRTCISKVEDTYLTHDENPETGSCYRCMIFTERDVNVIQYRESYCQPEPDLNAACAGVGADDILYSMFRLDGRPIDCPFAGPPFSFSYNRGHGECKALENQAESCTDGSKLLLKYQACADIKGAESSREELQCLATWKDGRNMFLVGTIKPADRDMPFSVDTFRCFLYEKVHHNGKIGYLISQSGDPSCTGLTSVTEGAKTFNFTKEDKEHVRCKYPSWVTQHHDWHFLDGSRNYHFTSGNSTLKVSYRNGGNEVMREEKVVCHNLEKIHPKDDSEGLKVKLVAHVTSGCDTGYVCMIFHKRDNHVIEVQQSSQKMTMPHEACSLDDPVKQPHMTLITSSLHKRSCPKPGRYTVMDLMHVPQLKQARRMRRKRYAVSTGRSQSHWKEDSNEAGDPSDDCQNADVQIGCSSSGQNEMIIQESCKKNDIVSAYSCHGSWEEAGTWYTIVSRNRSATAERETLCVAMRLTEGNIKMGRVEQQELWLSRPTNLCQRAVSSSQWTYKLTNQGVCEDLTRAASSSGSTSLLMRVSVALSVGVTLFSAILSR
ncbi:uncharacterized protein LOC106655313 isoform X1 [Trichogramma pretiosum]|uniref:uncharacterized protein LOC106655313 isoform X1 n=1 Tax=Trichogramma pretiosum TaxID=7493 RepID=UPI0006C9A02A|nr:uncharacterized protein LOC106655313 isoform X1 [Trichogramma pretiosum]